MIIHLTAKHPFMVTFKTAQGTEVGKSIPKKLGGDRYDLENNAVTLLIGNDTTALDITVEPVDTDPVRDELALKHAMRNNVFHGHINQMSTKDIASHFDCTLEFARRYLKRIVEGKTDDGRFEVVDGGVKIRNGKRFTYGYEDIDGKGSSRGTKSVKNLIWFLD